MWKDLTLEDKAFIDSFFRNYPPTLSDYTFTNLWIWNDLRHYQYQIIEEFLCIKFLDHGKETYLMPTGANFTKALLEKLISLMPDFCMRAISEEKIETLKTMLPKDFSITPERTRFDYLYSYEELKTLSGNALQPKRNLVHQFESNYDFHYEPLTVKLLPLVIQMHEKLPQTESSLAEFRALRDFEKLQIPGGALIVGDEAIAYTLGEKLNETTLDIHVEKALTEFKGAYQAINQLFLTHSPPVLYVNREEDLGLPSLEHAKHSYHPIQLLKKFKITIL